MTTVRASALALARRFACTQDGASAIEYGLIAATIFVVIVAAVTQVGSSLNTSFSNVAAGFH
jgi:pilus assembly protein Flp/PilA